MVKRGVGADKTTVRNMSYCASGSGANAAIVDVRDGKLLRCRPLRYTDDYSVEYLRPWKLTKGDKEFNIPLQTPSPPFIFATKFRTYSKNRILYPLKRVDWDPEGDRNTQNRGTSKFERITWDEATDIIASEIRRQYDTYGPYSILMQEDGHGQTKFVHASHGCMDKLMNIMGGAITQTRNPDSWEGWYWGAKHVWCQDPIGQGMMGNVFYDMTNNTKMILCWGCDQETTTWGWGGQMSSLLMYWFHDIGIKTVYICPDLNYGAAVHADKWIPVLPNTDLALQFAIAYVWIHEGLYDRDYIDTHTIGFDWLEYEVNGGEEGVAKTPEWAAEICGVPSRTIKALARKWHKDATTITHCNGGSYIRGPYSHEPARMEVCLLAMQGLGAPGRNTVKFIEWGQFGFDHMKPVPRAEYDVSLRGAYNGQMGREIKDHFIPKTLIPQAIMEESVLKWYGQTAIWAPTNDQFKQYQFPEDGEPHLHMIWSDTPCWSTCWNGGNKFVQALRSDKLDFVLVQHPWFENDCIYADIILPVSTNVELEDVCDDSRTGCFNAVLYEQQCIDHLGESLSDWETVCAIADKLGVLEEYTDGLDVAGCIKRGWDNSGAEDKLDFELFKERGYFPIPTMEEWEDYPPGFSLFYEDPENFPLNTPSGKLEIYSVGLQGAFPDDKERKPYPSYVDHGVHDERLGGERAKSYPFLLMSNHPRWRVHANMDDCAWFREIPTSKVRGEDGYMYEPVWINPVDASRLGIKNGDVVRLRNERGWTLGGARVTERIIARAVSQDHGAKLDPLEPGVSDRGGANNTIAPSMTTSKNVAGEVTSGFLVDVEKVDVEELRRQFPEEFARSYDPAVGLVVDNWIV